MGKLDCDVLDIVAVLQESDKNTWCKLLTRVSWNGASPVYDIRSYNRKDLLEAISNDEKIVFGKGITLKDDEIEKLALEILKEGFVDNDVLEDILNQRNSIFTIKDKPIKDKKIKVKIKRR